MDDETFNSDMVLIVAAVLGLCLAFERFGYREDQRRAFRWMMLAQLLLIAWACSDSWRGFLYMLFMPIGAYKVARIAGEPLAAWWRGRQPKGSKPTP
jgi:hypothetical protein